MQKRPSNRHFTEAARAAAKVARQRKREQAQDPNRPEMFVVRGKDDDHRFEWQIRRFGGVILDCSRTQYQTIQAAQMAGRRALQVFAART